MQFDALLEQAQQKCHAAGGRLTPKRANVLKTLLMANKPLSAYELLELLNRESDTKIQPMSAYRMLDFLVEMQLAHKLNSANKYVACAHIGCHHHHDAQHFVVCENCGTTQEINIDPQLMTQLQQAVADSDFKLLAPQLELSGLCADCQSKV